LRAALIASAAMLANTQKLASDPRGFLGPPPSKKDKNMYFSKLPPGFLRASAAVPDVRLVRKIDRRDASARAALVARVTSKFQEIPGLCITFLQARRLFDLREDVCTRILDRLVIEGTIGRTSEGQYYRNRAMP
jgi:hypothetical protein